MTNIKVAHIQRKPVSERYFSIENSFSAIQKHLGDFGVTVHVMICKYISQGIVPRLKNTLQAAKQKADIYHITGDVHYTSLLLPKKRTVLTIHDCVFMNHPSPLARTILKLFWLTLPAMRCAYIVCVSEKTKKEVLGHINFPESRIIVIPTVVNETQFQPTRKPFKEYQPTILHIGTTPNKNLERIAEALKGIPCKLDIVGPLSDEQINALVKNNIDFRNEVGISNERMAQKYQQADLLLFASTYEGFGMPILEAQLSGIPVITSNISPLTEVGGDAALFVDPLETKSISQSVNDIIANEGLRNDLIRKGTENAKRFSAKTVAAQYAALYHKMLSEV